MRAKRAEFVTSAADPGGFPPESLPELAFAGRSNVGKSSLINKLVGHAGLARTSNTPGRTRLLNWFRIDPPKGKSMQFVDLPGYGYAKVPRSLRDGWRPLVEAYLSERRVLRGVLVLVDSRRGAEADDAELLEWLDDIDVPAVVVLTKADKLPKSKRKLAGMSVKRELGLKRPPVMFSATLGDGVDDLWRSITKLASSPPAQ